MRLFVALDPPVIWRERLGAFVSESRREFPGARWVRQELLHVTLLFLGEVDDAAVAAVSSRLSSIAADQEPFELVSGEGGAFPPLGRPRVLFLGLRPPGPLSALARSVEESLADMGFRSDHPHSVPHLTLARIRQERPAGGRVGEGLTRSGWSAHEAERWRRLATTRLPAVPWVVSSLRLVRSVLSPQGPSHTPVDDFPFGSPAGPSGR